MGSIRRRSLVLTAAVLGLTACGGGSDGNVRMTWQPWDRVVRVVVTATQMNGLVAVAVDGTGALTNEFRRF